MKSRFESRGGHMTPPHRSCEAAGKSRAAPTSLKRAGAAPQPWPLHPHPTGHIHRPHGPPPQLPLFHTRHAEESAERPHLVTIVRPCGQSSLRKVTVLLNRRGVVSFEQLLLDVSEALGFPRWHRSRVTRLFTTYAREVKGVCDFFRGDVAFVALGKARPELSGVQEALEELFPDHSQYRAEALLVWEKKLRPAPGKAAKADSGYSEGTDSGGTNSNQETHLDKKNRTNMPTVTEHDDTQKSHKKTSCRTPGLLPNNLQRLRRVRGRIREPPPSVICPFSHEEVRRDVVVSSPTLCENCLVRRAKHQGRIGALSGRVPLPPVSRKHRGSSPAAQEVRQLDAHVSPSPPQPTGRDEGMGPPPAPPPGVSVVHTNTQDRTIFDPPSDGSEVSQSDIENLYEMGQVVGDGNFAVVRECRRRDDSQPLAVKIVERSKLVGREHMMQNELSLLGSLRHARIVRLFAHHHTRTHSYLVMELVSGGDLFEAISERGRFSEPEAGLMASDVSEALSYVHSKSIVHRDVKPENLLIEHVATGISRLKLGDFGLAMVVTEPVFTICGTPTYVAPEILLGTGYGVEVDVWALGVILYILLCGFPPFRSRDRDQEELFQIIKEGQLHFLSPYWDTISDEAKGLVRALLQSDPSARMTAEQSLKHPWVKVMASVCKQRPHSTTTEKNTDTQRTGKDPENVPAHISAPGATTERRSLQLPESGSPDDDKAPETPADQNTCSHATSLQKAGCSSTREQVSDLSDTDRDSSAPDAAMSGHSQQISPQQPPSSSPPPNTDGPSAHHPPPPTQPSNSTTPPQPLTETTEPKKPQVDH